MRLPYALCLCGVLFAAPLLGHAQGLPGLQLSAGPTLTGTGIGLAGTAKFTPMFSASAEFNAAPFGSNIDLGEIEDVEYEADLSVWSLTLMGHVHPMGGGFAVGAGVFFGGYGLDGTGIPQGEVEIGGETYPASELGTATAEFRLGGPSAVFEVGRRGRGFNVGLGVVVPTNPYADVAFSGSAADNPEFSAQLEQELEEIEAEIKVIPALPFLRIGYQIGFGN